MKKIYLVRHCKAEGQAPVASLTQVGFQQATELADFFVDKPINRIISSPYNRAVQTIEPLAKKLDLPVELDERLIERKLSSENLVDWQEKLRASFTNLDIRYDGGESSREATARILQVVEDISDEDGITILVTHGNLMALMLQHFNRNFGFEGWKSLSNPDVYLLKITETGVMYERVWE